VACGACGGGDRWMKTCLSAEGEKILLCDPCWKELGLVIVAGDAVVTARRGEVRGQTYGRKSADGRAGARTAMVEKKCSQGGGPLRTEDGRTPRLVDEGSGGFRTVPQPEALLHEPEAGFGEGVGDDVRARLAQRPLFLGVEAYCADDPAEAVLA
jgi:hypothetical protein